MITVEKTSDEGKAAIARHLHRTAPVSPADAETNVRLVAMVVPTLPTISEEGERSTSPTDEERKNSSEPTGSLPTEAGHSGGDSDGGSPCLVIGEPKAKEL